ncbi:hypothetical protein CALCODRAFT_482144 [Calocera cornea HHB12733]|uniref:Uncharacterized protein n=1 Tax=Calocera cornea HHB12733 TaxID=1353952 RepID=A0A165GZI7_9BASI|nr:hypothetical protein CALCODRAFT_482144 [Calocera cornea HHB12733]
MGRPELPILGETVLVVDSGSENRPRTTRMVLKALACCLLLGVTFRQLSFPSHLKAYTTDVATPLHESGKVGTADDWRTLPVGTVRWRLCGPGPEIAECGFIIVPTDYHDPSAGTTKIALGRVNATASPRKGMVIFGAGGPGGAGG